MNWRHIFLNATAFALLLAGGQARAADDELLDAPEVTISAAKSGNAGFYIRGDLGYSGWAGEGDPSLQAFDPVAGTSDTATFDDVRFGRPFSGSLGVGYQFNDMVRADLTGDYFSGRFDASGEADFACAGEAIGTSCAGDARADYRAIGIMANGYVDLATLAGFTPYLGAGLGVTRLDWSDVSLTTECVPGAIACSGAAAATQSLNGDSSWRFTYALMAGVSYDITERLKFDVNYRYSQIDDGGMFGGTDIKGFDDGLSRHEIRAGLRLSLW
ncbi:MAG TPA: outer membrane protein [Pararhizobium sp.]|uniref:outer membrane protein n=1 Tax=Pararhizobium sp. TaxID=1977563 RepID=UPI002CC3072A|nr:outer membrane protein [Pararhizobium sp.]HTO29586.1 outer membrane protein [Pararhizobium sp.]